jgi:hypothetical protein
MKRLTATPNFEAAHFAFNSSGVAIPSPTDATRNGDLFWSTGSALVAKDPSGQVEGI